MRLLAFLLLLPLTLAAQSGNASPKQHVRLQVDADRLALPLSITIKGKDRAAVDTRLEAIRQQLEQRLVAQPGWELREISGEFARAESKWARSSGGGSKLFGDEDTKGETTYAATAQWELRIKAEQGLKGVETLRAKTEGLVNAKSDDERAVVGHPEYVLTNPHDHRDTLLEKIKADFEEARKHLPEGQWTLELSGLSAPVNVVALGGKRFELSLGYRLAFITPKPEKTLK